MNPPPLTPAPPHPRPPLLPFIAAGLFTILGDFLLWPDRPGLSLGLFALAAAGAILRQRPAAGRQPGPLAALGLLLASAGQTAVELSFSNVLVLFSLLTYLLAQCLFPAVPGFFLRGAEAMLVLLRAPARWLGVARLVAGLPFRHLPVRSGASVLVNVVTPTLCLLIIFGVLLGSGNAIFSQELLATVRALFDWLSGFSLERVGFWLLLGTLALGLSCPVAPFLSSAPRPARLPRREPFDPQIALWRSWSILGALNALFFGANTIDAAYLWVHHQLPAGVNYSQYVHQGVYGLIAAVLLSAVVLVTMLEQAPGISGSRVLRALGLGWIAQNVFLTASVLLRLKLYVETYQLSTLRIYVAFFLLLVTVGFALLAGRILARRSLPWLLQANVLATFALFATVQFLDVERWVAEENVARWERDASRQLDVEYLATLGPSAYPALLRAAETPGRASAHAAYLFLQAAQDAQRDSLPYLTWRSRQYRPEARARELVAHPIATRRP